MEMGGSHEKKEKNARKQESKTDREERKKER
jgi:hypothetical protein